MWRSLLFIGGFLLGTAHQDMPQHDLTPRDMIEVIADFDITHRVQQPFFQKAYGVTNFESDPPAIWLFDTGTTADKRSTAIHELLHAHYHNLSMDPSEEFIRAEETRLYLKWFAGKE